MKFEEVLPAWRSGKTIRRGICSWGLKGNSTIDVDTGIYIYILIMPHHLLSDDWEVVEEYEEVEVWDWVWDNPVIRLTGVETGLTEQEVREIYFAHDGSKLLGRIEESKRMLKRRKQ